MERLRILGRRLLKREKPGEKPRGRWEPDPDLAALPQEVILSRLRLLTVGFYDEKTEKGIHELLVALPGGHRGFPGPRAEAAEMVRERLQENPDYLDFKERRRKEIKRQQRLRFKEQREEKRRKEALKRRIPYWQIRVTGLEERVGQLGRELEELKAEKPE